MIRPETRRRIDAHDPESWMRGVDARIVLDRTDDPAGIPPRHDGVPLRPLARPGRTLQRIGIRSWLRAIGACMTAVIASCLVTGFGYAPPRTPLVPMCVLMGVFACMTVGGARNARRPGLLPSGRGPQRLARAVEAFGWGTATIAAILIAMVVVGTLDVR